MTTRKSIAGGLSLRILAVSACCVASPAQTQTFLMAANSGSDTIALLDPNTGAVVDATFIEDDPTGLLYDFLGPKEAVQVNDEIWVTDQVADSIFRFDLMGNYLATIDPVTGMLDNIRGACFANGIFYVTGDGDQNGATENSVTMFDPSGTRLGLFTTGESPFDIEEFNGELLVADFVDDTIHRYNYMGSFLGNFLAPNGTSAINDIEQLSVTATGGIVAAGFSPPAGVYVYDAAGLQIDFLATTSHVRGVYELPSGIILYTEGELNAYDPVSGTSSVVDSDTTYQFLSVLEQTDGGGGSFCFGDGGDGMGCTPCPCGNDAAAGSLGGCLNSNSSSGQLVRSGSASVAGDTLRFEVRGANSFTFGILSSGDDRLPTNASNPCFGTGSGLQSAVLDGLRCAGGGVQRHGTRATDAIGNIGVTTSGWGAPNGPPGGLIAQGGFTAGQTRHYQVFYRDNPALGCGSGQNTTQGVTVTYAP